MEMAVTTLARGHVRLVLCLHTSVDPPASEWARSLAELSALLQTTPATQHVRMLIVTGGGGPDAKQRAQLKDVWGDRSIKVAVLVPGHGNALKRGLMTALSWLNPAMAFFLPNQLRDALAHLEQEQALEAVWEALSVMQKRLEPVRTLSLIAEASALPSPVGR